MRLRTLIFWLHLAAGVVAGSVILIMSVTGVLLAFERQIVAATERSLRAVQPPASDAPRLGLDAAVARARQALPDGMPTSVTLHADPTAAIAVAFEAERLVFVNPYTGAVLGEGATRLRRTFHALTDWHRWLGMYGEGRATGRSITGVCNAAFVVLIPTGLWLWWPRRWTRVALRAVTLPGLKLHGRARDWNWHNTVGFWSAPALLVIALTGLVMSYPWASNLLYTLAGSEPPTPQRHLPTMARGNDPAELTPGSIVTVHGGGAGGQGHVEAAFPGRPHGRSDDGGMPRSATLGVLFNLAAQYAPQWRRITLRVPPRGTPHVTMMIEEAATRHPYPRSILTLDAATAAVVKWEPYAGQNLGRTLRLWVRPVHTGEAGGLIGQAIAALASAGGAVLVWTGLALAWRRLVSRLRRERTVIANMPTGGDARSATLPHNAGAGKRGVAGDGQRHRS
ncbi:MAG TPA: PepSY-associated TM helix domain-containing protein [Alphaproteobacteria bacterium]|nr:PepSY-associated TM helix domain-containing protein [Alphaproteobacteria bacterium]